MALTLISGSKARSSFESQREDTQYMQGIALLRRWRNPLTLFSMGLANIMSDTINFNHFEDELVPIVDDINDATGGRDATSTTFTVTNVELFIPGTIWETWSQQATENELMLVKSTSGDIVTWERGIGNSGTGTATDANGGLADDAILRMSGASASPQGAPLPEIASTQETRVENFCQDIRTSFGISEVARDSKLRGEQELPYQQKKKAITHQQKIEMAFWYSQAQSGTGAAPNDGKSLFVAATGFVKGDAVTMGGINQHIVDNNNSNLIFEQDAITQTDFVDYLEAAFEEGGQESSKTKFFYCAPRFRSAIDTWGISSLQTFAGQTLLGVKVDRWTSSHGDIIFVTHSLFTPPAAQVGTFFYDNFLVDMEYVSHVHFGPNGQTRERKLRTYEAAGKTLVEMELASIVAPLIKLPDTHGRFRFKTYS